MSISTSPSLTNMAMLLTPSYLGSRDSDPQATPGSSLPTDDTPSTPSSTQPAKRPKTRPKYTHPCDACLLRKVKCDQLTPCSRCVKLSLPCTNKRQRKRSGGARLRQETREAIYRNALDDPSSGTLSTTRRTFVPTLPMDKLLACLQIYQTWYYGVWPVVSVAQLILRLVTASSASAAVASFDTTDNIQAYSLACALSAAIAIHATFITTSNALISLPPDLDLPYLVDEAVRARNFYNYRHHPSPESLLTSFFLYVYHVNVKGCLASAIMYLREAITMAQVLGMHSEGMYHRKLPAETHRLRKIYFLLLVTERFMSIEDDLPIILEPSIPYPLLEDEEYPCLLTGFTQLVRVFSIPDKSFFDRIIAMKVGAADTASGGTSAPLLTGGAPTPGWCSANWIISVQHQLSYIKILTEIPDVQKLNILLSKYWMKSLTWDITKKNDLLVLGNTNVDESLQPILPILIAEQFLHDTKDLPLFAFESNGPGVCIKLIGMAEGLIDSISIIGFKNELNPSHVGFQHLNKIYTLISKLKNDVTLPTGEYEKIKHFIVANSRATSLQVPRTGYISEVEESDESPDGQHGQNDNGQQSQANGHQSQANGHQNVQNGQSAQNFQNGQNTQNLQNGQSAQNLQNLQNHHDQPPSLDELAQGSPFTQITKAFCMPSMHPNKPFGVSFDEILTPENFDRHEFRAPVGVGGILNYEVPGFHFEAMQENHSNAMVQVEVMHHPNQGSNQVMVKDYDEYVDSTSTSSTTSSENRSTPISWN
ncbi:uncharacterized protein CANTADRAFT_26001 [Suhomyces tanzawaensis NRRL Y-17324]|uniref:Zn(2)-C6 fungal-type domain-containing protein n=1 Tax=Suhomyces tanzawaensis NRRL Y-17324 TaxID=984487 RepID=A0A1E4SH80_9ASCO|nr:uncharacterized protein CANTADRAFT_26001 [Suhomyces tanzawaensis NRRL Y-17324]ODV78864.1 hypothetical protein CANTADRAFT_26001 [Suhomyces tanzawaensis NRRL Y-17324]